MHTHLRSLGSLAKLGAAVFTVTAVTAFAGTSMLQGQVNWQYLFGNSSASSQGNTSFPVSSAAPSSLRPSSAPSSPAMSSRMSSFAASLAPTTSAAPSPSRLCCVYEPGGSCVAMPMTGFCPTNAFPIAAQTIEQCSVTCRRFTSVLKPRSSAVSTPSSRPASSPPSSSSSSSSSSSAISPSSSSSSSSSVASVQCCTCYYQDTEKCTTRSLYNCIVDYCKDGKDNDGDHLVDKDDPGCPQKSSLIRDTGEEPGRQNDDCTISDLSCISIHLRDCYTHPKMASCDKKRYSPMGPIQPHPAEWQCTKEYNVEIKHEIPGVCSPVAERFGCMLECTSAKCAEFINEGCGAFANLEDAEKAAKDMQQKLKEKGGFDTVIIGASQTTSNAECMQMAKFIIKEGSITKEFDPCKFGQRCLQPDEIYKCMEDGKEVYGSCCLGPDLLTPVHMPGTRCPRYCNFGAACDAPDGYSFCALPPQTKEEKKVACCPVFSPVDPFQNVEADVTNKTVCPVPKKNGLVHRVDSSFSCDSAKASAKQDALDEFNKMKDTCASMPGGAFTGTCFLPTVITSSPLTCTASSMCTWSCSWTQY